MPASLNRQQPYSPNLSPIQDAVDALAYADAEVRGAVFTRREVIDFILDLVGYTKDRHLCNFKLLEPSFGGGDFLLAAIERLIFSWKKMGGISNPYADLAKSICGVELHVDSFEKTKTLIRKFLIKEGISSQIAGKLVDSWLLQSDYLLTDLKEHFDFIVGNPPYIRQELIADVLMDEYRSRYKTIYDRADIYVPFIEHSLNKLNKKGHLGFICADRWMKNRYGGPLRKFVSENFHLKVYVDMVDTPAFHTDVIAYPAITVISKDENSVTKIARRPQVEKKFLSHLADKISNPTATSLWQEVKLASGGEPWIFDDNEQIALVRKLEGLFPSIEEAGCKIGIGVATGADKAFIARYDELDLEEGRKLPLIMTRDIDNGFIQWKGLGVINPFGEDGKLVDLKKYPRLKKYLEKNKDIISKRHVAKKSPSNWYRTIDRIYPELAKVPKLLIPDIKGEAHIVYDEGVFYPHHNLYYIISDEWHIKALQAVLMSGIAHLFVKTYSTKMRGGYLRFQAQYLRRIRLPRWEAVAPEIRKSLIKAAEVKDIESCNQSVSLLYGLNEKEEKILAMKGKKE